MFDVDSGKLLIIAIVALVVIGPKELPRVMRQVGQAVARMRKLAAEFQGQFNEAMREADLADIRADVAKLGDTAKIDIDFNPMADIRRHVTAAIEAPVVGASAEPAGPALPEPAIGATPLDGLAHAPEPQPATIAGSGTAPVVPETPLAEPPALEPSLGEPPVVRHPA